ncbi:hypothetical protein D3C75_956260 [compost metagenome]
MLQTNDVQQVTRPFFQAAAPVENTAWTAQHDVIQHRQMRDDRQFLVNDRNQRRVNPLTQT